MMRKLSFIVLLICFFGLSAKAQKHVLSYDDLKYLLQNNIIRADTFLVSKGYTIVKPAKGLKKRKYICSANDGSPVSLEVIIDGRKLTLNIETTELLQYGVIHDSIAQFGYTVSTYGDITAYHVKDLGDIYLTINETVPYSPIKKDYTITLRGDKDIVVLN